MMDMFRDYYQKREEKLVQKISEEEQSFNEQIEKAGVVMPRRIRFSSISSNIEYILSEQLTEFRRDFFMGAYKISIPLKSNFLKALAHYEYLILSAVLPNDKDRAEASDQSDVQDFFNRKIREFFGVEARFSPAWLFDAKRSEEKFTKLVKEIKGYIEKIMTFVELKYELLLYDVRILEGANDCLSTCLPCCFYKVGEIESGILAVKGAQLKRIHKEEIMEAFDHLVTAYRSEILPAKMVTTVSRSQGWIELQDMGEDSHSEANERTPFLRGGGDELVCYYDQGNGAGTAQELDDFRRDKQSLAIGEVAF